VAYLEIGEGGGHINGIWVGDVHPPTGSRGRASGGGLGEAPRN